MRIFCRSSMAKFVDAAEIFSLTKAGITFFADFFDFPFPFPKYDQVFAPEFNWGVRLIHFPLSLLHPIIPLISF